MPFSTHLRFLQAMLLVGIVSTALQAQQPDTVYARKILENTTDDRFINERVDHLPYSDAIPSPLDHFGSIIGEEGVLHYTHEIHGYLRALAQASPRVSVRTIGWSEEGREMMEVMVSDEANLEQLEANREMLNRLADPRNVSEEEAEALIDRATPVYYVTAGLHAPETGSPEMVMELAYRLAVEESPYVASIRRNVLLVFTPVTDVDGRDRIVDIYKYRAEHNGIGPNLTYWGKYVAHDNNRDGFGMALALTRNVLASFFHWRPQVMHDLHESVPYLYISTGTGPYNEFVDPITIDEWHTFAFEDVSELTRMGMPGVWTHGFYNGWAANYLIWMANIRNSTGRFYETFGNSVPKTVERKLTSRSTSVQWYRSNPPLEKTMWSLRNNTNYMQSGVLSSLKYVADNRRRVVENFYLKGKRAVEAGNSEPPYAWVVPHTQKRPLATIRLLNLLMAQGLEVHRTDEGHEWDDEGVECLKVVEGDYVIRLDQPFRTLARVLLDKQTFPDDEDPPYDDTGWTLPFMHRVDACKVVSKEVYDVEMSLLDESIAVSGVLSGDRSARYYVIDNTTDDAFYTLRFRLPGLDIEAAEEKFEAAGKEFAAGSFIITSGDNEEEVADRLREDAERTGLVVHGLTTKPDVRTHPVEVPRIGLIHTWVSTPQDGGWWRFAFDTLNVPYIYLSEQDLADQDLSAFDVLVFPRTYASTRLLVNGLPRIGDPLPWRNTPETPNIGVIDETEDQRVGMGFEGVANLKAFIERGGLFITEGSSSALVIDMGITQRISITQPRGLQARGSVMRSVVADTLSPIVYGYEDVFPLYFNQQPVFRIDTDVESYMLPEWYQDELWKQVPRVVVKFAEEDILMSGMLRGEQAIAGKPAVVDVPVGDGHVVLFANRPVRRWNTQGSHGLVFNAILHWNDLATGRPERPEEEQGEKEQG